MKKWSQIKRKNMTEAHAAKLDRQIRVELARMELRELREMAGKTQSELAKVMKQTQSQLSKLEARDDHLMSSLRKYVAALGGQLEVVAIIGNERIKLDNV